MDREVIKRKIEKLLALSKSTNESEAMSAARTARKLMLKYHISMADGEKTGGEIPLSSLWVSIKELRFKRTPMRQHHLMLAFLLAKNFRCKTFHQYGEIPCVKFIGFEEDAFAALTLLQYLIRFMEQGAGQYTGMKRQEQSFKDGFCAGVFETFEAQNQEEPEYGLMLETPAEVMEAYKKLNLKKFRHVILMSLYTRKVCYNRLIKGGRQTRSVFKMPSDDLAGAGSRRVPIP